MPCQGVTGRTPLSWPARSTLQAWTSRRSSRSTSPHAGQTSRPKRRDCRRTASGACPGSVARRSRRRPAADDLRGFCDDGDRNLGDAPRLDQSDRVGRLLPVEWGGTTAFGQSSADGPLAAVDRTVAVTLPLSALSPSTRYYWRLVAVSAAGVTTGPTRWFTTTSRPPRTPAAPSGSGGSRGRCAAAAARGRPLEGVAVPPRVVRGDDLAVAVRVVRVPEERQQRRAEDERADRRDGVECREAVRRQIVGVAPGHALCPASAGRGMWSGSRWRTPSASRT